MSHLNSREKLYTCESEGCGKGFFRSAELVRHNVVHTGEKKYECELCQMKFFYSSYLERHKRQRHRKNFNDAISNSEQKLPEHINFLSIMEENMKIDSDNHNDRNLDPLSNLELETHSLDERRKRRKQKLQVRSDTELEFL